VTKQGTKGKAAKSKQPTGGSKSSSKSKNGQNQDAESTAPAADKPTSTRWNKGSASRQQETEQESHNA
jgi:hypothetical protein